jgi:hypothetical protein
MGQSDTEELSSVLEGIFFLVICTWFSDSGVSIVSTGSMTEELF